MPVLYPTPQPQQPTPSLGDRIQQGQDALARYWADVQARDFARANQVTQQYNQPAANPVEAFVGPHAMKGATNLALAAGEMNPAADLRDIGEGLIGAVTGQMGPLDAGSYLLGGGLAMALPGSYGGIREGLEGMQGGAMVQPDKGGQPAYPGQGELFKEIPPIMTPAEKPFYSEVLTHAQMGPKSMPADQYLGWLKKKPGVKEAELEESGLKAILEARGKEKITRQEVTDALENAPIFNLRETWQTGDDATAEALGLETTEYDTWTTPGEKSNYRELLLNAPDTGYKAPHFRSTGGEGLVAHARISDRTSSFFGEERGRGSKIMLIEELQSDLHQEASKPRYPSFARRIQEEGGARQARWFLEWLANEEWAQEGLNNSGLRKFLEEKGEEIVSAEEVAKFAKRHRKGYYSVEEYQKASQAYEQASRARDGAKDEYERELRDLLTDESGKALPWLEGWIRKNSGYEPDQYMPPRLLGARINSAIKALRDQHLEGGVAHEIAEFPNEEVLDAIRNSPNSQRLYDANDRYIEASRTRRLATDKQQEMRKQLPSAPLKSNYREVMMKRLLWQAAHEDKDMLALTGGEIQADRYDLANYADRIVHDGRGEYQILLDGQEQTRVHLSDDELDAHFGEDLANQIRRGEADFDEDAWMDQEIEIHRDMLMEEYEVREGMTNEVGQFEDFDQELFDQWEEQGLTPEKGWYGDDDRGNIEERWMGSVPKEHAERMFNNMLMDEAAEAVKDRIAMGDLVPDPDYMGLDLGGEERVGGLGMISLYDKVIPNELKKILKRFDKKARLDITNGTDLGTDSDEMIWYVELTDALKKKILKEGAPIYAAGAASTGALSADLNMQRSQDDDSRQQSRRQLSGQPRRTTGHAARAAGRSRALASPRSPR